MREELTFVFLITAMKLPNVRDILAKIGVLTCFISAICRLKDANVRRVSNGYSFIQGRKMSKSLKNFITIADMLKQYSSDDFRMFCMLNHYAARVQLDDNGLQQAQQMWTDMKNVRMERIFRKNIEKEY